MLKAVHIVFCCFQTRKLALAVKISVLKWDYYLLAVSHKNKRKICCVMLYFCAPTEGLLIFVFSCEQGKCYIM